MLSIVVVQAQPGCFCLIMVMAALIIFILLLKNINADRHPLDIEVA